MKFRCRLGFHGPVWTDDPQFLGPYSRRNDESFQRVCPHCHAVWQGSIVDRHVGHGIRVMDFGPWTKLK